VNTLIAKIAKVSAKVGSLKTDKRNAQQNYDYISADKILEKAGDALAEAGIVITPSIVAEKTEEVSYTDSYNKAKTRYDCVLDFMLKIEDGESEMSVEWRGRGSDYAVPDKAFYKAITSGHKYFIMKLLNIGVGNEDGEHENHDEDAKPKAQQPRPPSVPKRQAEPPVDADTDTMFMPDEPVALPNDKELELMGKWRTRRQAQEWAVASGACANEHEARNSFENELNNHGGVLTKENTYKVLLAVLRKWEKKIAAQEQAMQPELVPA